MAKCIFAATAVCSVRTPHIKIMSVFIRYIHSPILSISRKKNEKIKIISCDDNINILLVGFCLSHVHYMHTPRVPNLYTVYASHRQQIQYNNSIMALHVLQIRSHNGNNLEIMIIKRWQQNLSSQCNLIYKKEAEAT